MRYACLLFFLSMPLAAQQGPPSCSTPEFRQFDFWIGTWDVFGPNGQRVGENTIDSVLTGCVLHEQWTNAQGIQGRSYNMWDRTRSVWHQTWVSAGGLLVIEGGLVNGAMVMEGETRGRNGAVRNRITWTPVARDSVRQHWETWNDSTSAWVTAFDGMYVRRR